MAVEFTPNTSSGHVRQAIQIEMLKTQNEMKKIGVLTLYQTLDGLKPGEGDAFIPSSGNGDSGNTYSP